MDEVGEIIARCMAKAGSEVPDKAAKKSEKEPLVIESSADVVRLPEPSSSDEALASVPLVRHWLFAPDGSRLRYRELMVRVQHGGREILQTIRIGDRFAEAGTGYGILKARHQRMLFAMQELWQKQGGRLARVNGVRQGCLCASSWELEQAMFGTHGGREKRLIRAMVQQLSSIPVEIRNYIGPDGEPCDLDITGLILGAEFNSSRRGDAGQMGFPWVEVYFSSVITRAFEQQAVKPLNLKVLGELRDTAALLYPKIDYLLANNSVTEMRLDGLVEKLGLAGGQLSQRAYRRRKFQAVVDELKGQPLSKEGYVIDARLVPTADGRDHKFVAERRRK